MGDSVNEVERPGNRKGSPLRDAGESKGNTASFPQDSPLVDRVSEPCIIFHDPHGIHDVYNGITIKRDHNSLINSDLAIVAPIGNGILRFEDTGVFNGACCLKCHGLNHGPKTY